MVRSFSRMFHRQFAAWATIAIAAMLTLGLSGTAAADPLNFAFTSSTGASATFTLPSSPVPDSVTPYYFLILNPNGTFNGVVNGAQYVAFHGDGPTGVFEYYMNGGGDNNYYGLSTFTGGYSTPTFLPGTYSLADINTLGATGTLKIFAPGAPAPEIGLGLLSSLAALAALLLTRLGRPKPVRVPVRLRATGRAVRRASAHDRP